MSLYISAEPLNLMLDEMKDLAREHAVEVANPALASEEIIINPSWVMMSALAEANMFLSIAVRDGPDGPLVGYATFILFVDMHRTLADGTPLLHAQDDAYYVAPSARGPRVALRLFAEAEAELRLRGVRKLSIHYKPYLGGGGLLEALGFVADDVIMVKYLAPLEN